LRLTLVRLSFIIVITIISIIIAIIVIRDNGITFTPPYPTDDGAG
jgi:hypothetical protein